jgi:hypothetical protein
MDEYLVVSLLLPGQRVAGLARMVASARGQAQTGRPFHRLTLADASGRTVVAHQFAVEDLVLPPLGMVVPAAGVVERYRGRVGLKLAACTVAAGARVEPFQPRIPATRRATLADLDALLATLTERALRSCQACREASFRPEVKNVSAQG